MKALVYLLVAVLGYSSPSYSAAVDVDARDRISADRLNEARRNIPGTIVVRHNQITGAIEILKSNEILPSNASSVNAISNRNFIRIETNKPVRGELDRDTSRSSWFFIGFGNPYHYGYGFNNFYYGNFPNYGYGNYGYYPYYPTYYYNNFYYPYYGYYNYLSYPYNYFYYRW